MGTETLTLSEFLTARLDEDEATAGELVQNYDGIRPTPDHGLYADDYFYVLYLSPERVLAEVAAKRRIVELHGDYHECPSMTERTPYFTDERPCPTARGLASVYADHPDFREEWKA